MKKSYYGMLLVLMLVAFLGGCSLFDLPAVENQEPVPDHDVYVSQAMNTMDQIWAKLVDENQGVKGGRIQTDSVLGDSLEICGLEVVLDTVSSSASGGRSKSFKLPKLVVEFNSLRCEVPGTIKREGTVIYELVEGDKIGDINSVVKFSFIDFKVTDLVTNKSTTFNGEKFIKNLSGGKLRKLGHCHGNYLDLIADYLHDDDGHLGHGELDDACNCKLVQSVRSTNFNLKYGDGRETTKNIAKTKVFYKLRLNNYRMFVYGDTTVGGYNNVADWGTQPNGKTYYSVNEGPIVYQSCFNFCKFTKGKSVRYVNGGREITTIFGVDKWGKPSHNCFAYGLLNYYFEDGDSIASVIPYN